MDPAEHAANGPLLAPGRLVKDYRIGQKLGQGGMGAVFEAEHQHIGRRAAVKVLLPELSQNPQFANRFLNEAKAVNLIRHPGLVEIFDYGLLEDGTAYIIMEFLEGEALSGRLRRAVGPLPETIALGITWHVAVALAAAHSKDIVHRDLKPDNVMLVPDLERAGRERVKILDFGIAKMAAGGPAQFKTATGTTIGTPEYMAPEQCTGSAALSGKADVYALGIMLYEMLAGHLPFRGEMSFDVMRMQVRDEPPPLLEQNPELRPAIAELVHRMLRKSHEERPDMNAVVEELERLGMGRSSTALPAVPMPPRESDPSLNKDKVSVEAYLHTLASSTGAGQVALKSPTLDGTKGQAAPPPASKRGVYAMGGAALVVLLGGISLFAGARRDSSSPQTTTAAAPAAPSKVRLRLVSEPAGAQVVRIDDGQVLGTTPWEREEAPGPGELILTIKRDGFADGHVSFGRGQSAEKQVTLKALQKAAAQVMPPVPAKVKAPAGKKKVVRQKGGFGAVD